MTLETDTYTDVVELCALLQCLGFTVKSLDTSDCNATNASQDVGSRTVVVNCQRVSEVERAGGGEGGLTNPDTDKSLAASGLHVVLESNALSCSCPTSNQQNSGFWQVCGMTGGKQSDTETGSTLLGSLPKPYRERLARELKNMVRCIKELNDSHMDRTKDPEGINKSTSMVELGAVTPEKIHLQIKTDTPTRYRSLDTLTSGKDDTELQRNAETSDDNKQKVMCRRQSTYTVCSTAGSIRKRNKTSSPIQASDNNLLDNLVAAEKAAEDLRNKISIIINDFVEEPRDDSSMSSLALDVSRISVLKATETSKAQFASSPNLSGFGTIAEETKSRLRRADSASTSNLLKPAPKEGKMSKLRRFSPNFLKMNKDNTSSKDKLPDGKPKPNVFKPKIVTPVRKPSVEPSPNLSSSKKKFSHIKSTIPRPTPTKKE